MSGRAVKSLALVTLVFFGTGATGTSFPGCCYTQFAPAHISFTLDASGPAEVDPNADTVEIWIDVTEEGAAAARFDWYTPRVVKGNLTVAEPADFEDLGYEQTGTCTYRGRFRIIFEPVTLEPGWNEFTAEISWFVHPEQVLYEETATLNYYKEP